MKDLIQKSVFIIREAKTQFKNPAVLWSTGKDSTAMLALIKESFFGKIPFPVIHLDTGYKFPEIYDFRDKLAKEWDLNLIVHKRDNSNFHPDKTGHFKCCMELKTNALKDVLKKHKFDALIMSIRRDEHYMRNLERYYSPRDEELKWHLVRPKTKDELKEGDAPYVSEQQVEFSGWNLFQSDFGTTCNHVRVHPILHWTELNVWEYMKQKNIPFNPLYISKNGHRYRSLGCIPCTTPIKSDAKTIDDIIEELKNKTIEEIEGRR
jgi:sulfate adenylyltransferase subunit 2